VPGEDVLRRAREAIKAELGEQDGLGWNDIPDVIRVGTEVAEGLGGLTGVQKKEAVIATIRPIYEERVSTLLLQHDIPWVPAAIERALVDPAITKTCLWAFDQIVPPLIDLIVKASRGELRLNKPDAPPT
jgi:hypothetical protein